MGWAPVRSRREHRCPSKLRRFACVESAHTGDDSLETRMRSADCLPPFLPERCVIPRSSFLAWSSSGRHRCLALFARAGAENEVFLLA